MLWTHQSTGPLSRVIKAQGPHGEWPLLAPFCHGALMLSSFYHIFAPFVWSKHEASVGLSLWLHTENLIGGGKPLTGFRELNY